VEEGRAEVVKDILTTADRQDKIRMEEHRQQALLRHHLVSQKLLLLKKTAGALSLSLRRTAVEATQVPARLHLNS